MSLQRITVLSPHRDDAVFSLALSLKRWTSLGIPCRILNFFTESQYAPRCNAFSTGEISHKRRVEDIRALRLTSRSIEIVDCGWKDAPIRLSLPLDQVMAPESRRHLSATEIRHTAQIIRRYCPSDLVIAPLALGFHVDHQLISTASTAAVPGKRLAFYEDLPYATWTEETEIKRKVDAMRWEGGGFMPCYNRQPGAVRQKARLASTYGSQMSPEEVRPIAHYAEKYRSAERIWLPKRSAGWNSIR